MLDRATEQATVMKALFDQLFEASPNALILVDQGGVIVKANQRARRLFGYGNGDLIGRQVDQLLPEAVRSLHRRHRAEYMAEPRSRPMGAPSQTLLGQRQNGEVFPVEIALSPLHDDTTTCYLATVREVSSELRERQDQARARHDRLVSRVAEMAARASDEDLVIAGLPAEVAAALVADAVAIVIGRSEPGRLRLRAGTGLGSLEVGDLPCFPASRRGQAVPMPDEALLWDALDIDEMGLDTRALRAAGIRSSLSVPLVDRAGSLGALVVLSRRSGHFDQDARYCLASVAGLLSAFLQRLHSEEQLAHAQRLEAIGQLTGGIAHDFNNLLTVISGNLQLVDLECPQVAPIRPMLQQAQRAVDSAAELTSKLLAFARRQHLRPHWVDARALLLEMSALFDRTLGETVQVSLQVPPELPPLFVDRNQLEAALLNLALNARDAMSEGGQLRIEAGPRTLGQRDADIEGLPEGRYLGLAVTDTGAGMPQEVLEHVFEPFFTTKPQGEGNGLGLSMVYGFVRQSGGTVRIDSGPGEGTRIDLLLPLPEVDQASEGLSPPDVEDLAPAPTGNERVLVVEDDPAVGAVTAAFLRSLGYTVETVVSAEQALQRLGQGGPIDLVLSDVVLGRGVNGIELARRLRDSRPHLPVLLISGYAHETLRKSGLAAQPFPLLHKPYRRDHLARALRGLLDAAPGADPPSAPDASSA